MTTAPRAGWWHDPALGVVAAYALAATAWVVVSDGLLVRSGLGDGAVSHLAGLKAFGFIALTAVVLYRTLRRLLTRLEVSQSQLAENEKRYRAMFESHRSAMLVVDPDTGTIVDANPAAAAFYGYTCERLRELRSWDLSTRPTHEVMSRLGQLVRQELHGFRSCHRPAGGEPRDVDVYASPVVLAGRTLLLSIIHDQSELRRSERALTRLARLHAILSNTNQMLVRVTDRASLFEGVCRTSVEQGGFLAAWIGMLGADGTVRPVARAGDDPTGFIDAVQESIDVTNERGLGPAGIALRTGERSVFNNFRVAPATRPWWEAARRAGVAAAATLPLRQGGRLVGVLTLYAAEVDVFGASELATLDQMAADVSFGLDHLEREHERARLQAELEVAEARWRFALEGGGHGVWEWDGPSGRVFYSTGWKSILGYDEDDIGNCRSEWESRIHPDDRAAVYAERERYLSGVSTTYRTEHRLRCKDGTYRWVLSQGRAITRPGDGAMVRMIGTNTDVSERRQMESALRESEERLRLAVAAARMGTWDVDMTVPGYAVNWSDDYGALFGRDRSRFPTDEAAFLSCVHPDDRDAVRGAFRRAVVEDVPYECEFRVVKPDGTSGWVSAHGRALRDPQGRPVRMLGVGTDCSERKAAELALAESERRLHELSRRLMDGHETERRAVAHELHEGIGQSLSALKMTLSIAARGPGGFGDDGPARCLALVDEMLDRVRGLSHGLWPSVLVDLGLVSALRSLTLGQAAQTGQHVVFRHGGEPAGRLTPDAEVACYRVAQAALAHALGRAETGRVRVTLRRKGDELRLKVTCDGPGFDAAGTSPPDRVGNSLGLVGMRERTTMNGGRFNIRTFGGRVASMKCAFPAGRDPRQPG